MSKKPVNEKKGYKGHQDPRNSGLELLTKDQTPFLAIDENEMSISVKAGFIQLIFRTPLVGTRRLLVDCLAGNMKYKYLL